MVTNTLRYIKSGTKTHKQQIKPAKRILRKLIESATRARKGKPTDTHETKSIQNTTNKTNVRQSHTNEFQGNATKVPPKQEKLN